MTATYPADASMTSKKPDKGISSSLGFKSAEFVSQAGYSKSRLASRRSFENINLNYTNITGTNKSNIQAFYEARFGDFESFIFDKTHINESGLITVKFKANSLRITRVAQKAVEADSIYSVSFALEQVYR
jgi:hypothetical protein